MKITALVLLEILGLACIAATLFCGLHELWWIGTGLFVMGCFCAYGIAVIGGDR